VTAISQPEDARAGQAGAQVAEKQEPTEVPPSAARIRLGSPVLQGCLALLIYLVVWIGTAFRPVVHHATLMLLDQKSQDPNFYVWGLRWWPYAIAHGLNPLYSSEIYAPAGHSLAWVTTAPPVALLAIPLTLLTGPVVAFNLLSAIALPLSAWAAFVLCRRLTSRFWASLVGGAVFGFSAYEMNHGSAGQLNVIYSLMLPLIVYLVVLWREERISSRTFVILAGLAITVQFYLFLETFADMTALLVISLVLGLALAGPAWRPLLIRLAKVFALAYVIALVLAAPYLAYVLNNKPPRSAKVTGMDLASLVIPRPGRTFGIAWLTHAAAGPHSISAACYVGVPLLVLAVLLAFTSWQSRLVRYMTIMLAFIVVAAIGPVVYVEGRRTAVVFWAKLFHLPLVRNAYPLRLMLFAYLILAVATALFLAGPAKRVPWARWGLGVLVVVFIALDTVPIKLTSHTTEPVFISSGQYRRQLAPGEIVVVISNVGNAGMLWQAQSDFYMRIAGGFINAGLNHRTDLPKPVQDLASASPSRVATFESFVRTDHVGAILLDAANEPRWVGIFHKLGLSGHRVGGVVVYPTHGCQSCHPLNKSQIGPPAPATA
jgi:hypothetical protein